MILDPVDHLMGESERKIENSRKQNNCGPEPAVDLKRAQILLTFDKSD